ncbi:MAG: peptide deformylase [Treponemataceae bacterium]|nr:peptide deformylase [Treponemataceae bacterium]
MEIVQLGDPVLRQKAVPVEQVTDELKATISEMFDTMIEANGVGLAAPQIGRSERFFVIISDDDVRRVFINPQIVSTSQETCEMEEGCLSLPKLYENIVRPKEITVQALNENGKPFTLHADGLLARIIQHEYDHLDGFLYIDRGDPEFKEKAEVQFARRAERRSQKLAAKQAKQAKLAAKLARKNGANA